MKNIYCSIIQPLQGCISCLHTKLRIACGAINIFPLQGKSKSEVEFNTNNVNSLMIYSQYLNLSKFRRDLITFTRGCTSSFHKNTKIYVFKTKFLKLSYRVVKSQRDLITLTPKATSGFLKIAEVVTLRFKTLKLNYEIAKSRRDLITIAIGETYGMKNK